MSKSRPKRTKTADLWPVMCEECEGRGYYVHEMANVMQMSIGNKTARYEEPVSVTIQTECTICDGRGTVER